MDKESNELRDRLLGQTPRPGDLASYRQRVTAMVQSNAERIRRERLLATLFWIFCAASATAWLWFSADSARLPRGPFLACVFFTWGGVEIVKHYINALRIDLLKEIKELQLQVFELQNSAHTPAK
jgi:hypothetical protein